MSADYSTVRMELADDSYSSGFKAGRRFGFDEGLKAAVELVNGKTPEQVLTNLQEKAKAEGLPE